MKIKIIIASVLLLVPIISFADVWYPSGTPTNLQPVVSTWGLKIPAYATSSSVCLSPNSSGVIGLAGCSGSGGTNFFTNSGATTTLTTGSIIRAAQFNGTSTATTMTLAGSFSALNGDVLLGSDGFGNTRMNFTPQTAGNAAYLQLNDDTNSFLVSSNGANNNLGSGVFSIINSTIDGVPIMSGPDGFVVIGGETLASYASQELDNTSFLQVLGNIRTSGTLIGTGISNTGQYKDGTGSVGTVGQILSQNSGNTKWISTSSLGLNFFTNSSATTSLSTGSILTALTGTFGTLNATSTGTSTFSGYGQWPAVTVGQTPLTSSSSLTGLVSQVYNFSTTSTQLAHGTAEANGMLFAGTKNGFIYVLKTPDTDLTNYQVVPAIFNEWIAEMRFATTTGLMYTCSNSGVIVFNPTNIASQTALYNSGGTWGSAPSCDTDGTYLYGVTDTAAATFFKIQLTNGALIATSSWTGVGFGHSVAIDPNGQYFYASTGAGSNGFFAKVSTSNLTVTSTSSPHTEVFTDDSTVLNGYFYVGTETANYIYQMNTSTMALSTTSVPAQSYGVYSSASAGGTGNDLYNVGIGGYLTFWPNGSTTQAINYNFNGVVPNTQSGFAPNEMWITPGGRIVMTDWFNNRIVAADLGLNKVGVDTPNPQNTLHVAGNIMTDTINSYFENLVTLIVNTINASTTNTGTLSASGAISGSTTITALGNIYGNSLSATNSLAVGFNASSPRGIFDVENASTSLKATTAVSVAVTPFSGNLTVSSGNIFTFTVYPYTVINGTTYYAAQATSTSYNNVANFNPYHLTVSWNSIPSATGYKIVLTDPQDGYTNNYYISTTSTSFVYGTGCEITCVVHQSPMITTPSDTVSNFYVSSTTGQLQMFAPDGGIYLDPTLQVLLGATTSSSTLDVNGSEQLTGAFNDSTNASGTLGQILKSTGTSTLWVSTSTLGLNFFTNTAATTSLTTGTILNAPTGTFGSINATSTSVESILNNLEATSLNVATTSNTYAINLGTANSTINANTGLSLCEAGDIYGSICMSLYNRVGTNGALFQNLGLDLVDFAFDPSSGVQQNIRYEHRGGSTIGTGNSGGEFQIGVPAAPNFIIGAGTTDVVNGNFGIATATPNTKLDVYGDVRFESASSSVITPSISGTLVSVGCDTATTSVSTSISSSTTVFSTTPQNFPGINLYWQSYLSASGVITTEVCSTIASVTPTASKYVVKIIQ